MKVSSDRMLLVSLFLAVGSVPCGGATTVMFDISPTVACRDVTDQPAGASEPHRRLVEATIQVSTILAAGSADTIDECLYQFYAPDRRMLVEDFAPKTTLVTDVVGNVTVRKAEDASRNLHMSLGGQLQDVVRGDLQGGHNRSHSSALSFERLPARELLTAAGTLARGNGVYFKLKPTPQTSIEGSREFRIVLYVPETWRADYLRAICVARDAAGRECGSANYILPLYDMHDAVARRAAVDLVEAERQLLATAGNHRRAVRKASMPTVAHELSLLEPKIPADWLAQVISGTTASQSFESSLPVPVQAAIGSYRQSRQSLSQLAWTATQAAPTAPVAVRLPGAPQWRISPSIHRCPRGPFANRPCLRPHRPRPPRRNGATSWLDLRPIDASRGSVTRRALRLVVNCCTMVGFAPDPARGHPTLQASIVLLPGDGIGPEIVAQGRASLERIAAEYGHQFAFASHPMGGCAIDACGTPLPDVTAQACRDSDAVLLGAVGGPQWDDPRAKTRPEQGLLAIRKTLGLFANLRPITTHPALVHASPLKPAIIEGTDILFIRELTGGIYFGASGRRASPQGEEAFNEMAYSVSEVERVVRVAGQAALTRRNKVTSVDKANVLEVSRLWREVAARVMRDEFPQVEYEVVLVDAMAMHLLSRPRDFDVVVTGNLFGDILTDEASMLPGSLGLLPSASLGIRGPGLFEPIHGSAPDLAGRDVANPLATILAAAMLLRHSLGLPAEAAAIEQAVAQVLDAGYRTADIAAGGTAMGTAEMGRLVCDAIRGPR